MTDRHCELVLKDFSQALQINDEKIHDIFCGGRRES